MSAALLGGLIGGGLLSAGGSVAGGLLGQASNSSGDRVSASLNPGSNFATQAAVFDALGQIGFADPTLLMQSGPAQRILAQIQAMPVDEKIKRRAQLGIQQILDGGQPTFSEETQHMLARIGLSMNDLPGIAQQQTEFERSIASLGNVGTLQEGVIRDRLAASAGIANTAAGLATGQNSLLQNQFREQILRDSRREIDRAEETARLRAQFSGTNPGFELSRLNELRSDLQFDSELRAIEKALMASSGAQNLLSAGSANAQGAAGLSGNFDLGALGISAQQAAAANAVNAQINQNNATSLANGIGGGIGALGNTLSTLGVLQAFGVSAPAAGRSVDLSDSAARGVLNNPDSFVSFR